MSKKFKKKENKIILVHSAPSCLTFEWRPELTQSYLEPLNLEPLINLTSKSLSGSNKAQTKSKGSKQTIFYLPIFSTLNERLAQIRQGIAQNPD